MNAAIEELTRVASTARDAKLYVCISHAHAAISYAERGSIGPALVSLGMLQLMAENHLTACNDPRVLAALGSVRRECRQALAVRAGF